MTQFTAVVTTGIYCRPGCGAKPLPANIRTFGSAAAAEASGYRACFQCRPYRSPQSVGWDAPELVCRAVRLILAGALDDGTEAELGARLGISGRHLRRLFRAHVGATPDQLAVSQRTHFARRLLDDTDFTIAEIAFMAGFGSVRQLNRLCKQVFRDTPTALRAHRRASDRLTADGGIPLRLPIDGPFEWDAMLSYLDRTAIPRVENVEDGVYRRTILVEGNPGVIEVESTGDNHLVLTAHLPHWDGLIHLVAAVRRIFSLDANPEEAAPQLANDVSIGELVRDRPGLRVPGTWDPLETAVKAIIDRRRTRANATETVRRLVERYGTEVPGLQQMRLTHTRFPTASVLASAGLNDVGIEHARAEAIRGFARAVASDEIRLDGSIDLDLLLRSIASIPGVGERTGHYVACGSANETPFLSAIVRWRRRWITLAFHRPRTRPESLVGGSHGEPSRPCISGRQLLRSEIRRVQENDQPRRPEPRPRIGSTGRG